MATISEALAIAIQHHQAGRLQAAQQIYEQILQAVPNHADALHLLGVLAHQAGKHEIAVGYIERAIALNGNAAIFHNNLGGAYYALGRIPEAVASYRRALELKSDVADTHNNLGIALKDQGKLDEAIACYRRALQLNPDYAEAHYSLGIALQEQGELNEAIACYRRALELRPDYAEAHNNLGTALTSTGGEWTVDRGRWTVDSGQWTVNGPLPFSVHRPPTTVHEAIACFRRALQLKPDYAEAYGNLGTALQGQGLLAEASACYRRALELKPDYAEAHWNRALLWLRSGNWAEGWPEYEWRWQTKDWRPRCSPQMLWTGQSLQGKTILLHAEQGLGDTIQFIRYAPVLGEYQARVVVECQKPLLRLLASCPGIAQLIGEGEELPRFDVRAPLLSLPLRCKTTFENLPASVPYLFPVSALVAQWRERLSNIAGFKVGICWQGNPRYRGDCFRSIPLRCFAALGRIAGVTLISLQKGFGREN